MSDNEDLVRDIFGGSDSELSSEDEFPDKIEAQKVRRKSPGVAPEQESSGPDSEDNYHQQQQGAKRVKRTRRAKPLDEDGRPTRKRKRRPIVEEDLSQLPPEQAAKVKLDMQIEAILKPKKGNRMKRKKKDADEELDRYADEEVSRLRETMLAAAADDDQSNKQKLPATSKLKLLPQVLEILRKASLAQSIIDNNLLEGVRRWLEPLPDRSLPALDIQREFFTILRKMDFIDTNVLKESRLGRVVLFYTKCKRVTPDIGRQADYLVSAWSRPIIKRSASYRDRIVPTAATDDGTGARNQEKLNVILARAREADKNRVRKNAVTIPQRELGSYTVAPRSDLFAGAKSTAKSVDLDIERRRRNAERMRTLTRRATNK